MENILDIKHLYKSYEIAKGEQQPILRDVNLQIKKGEFVSVMGPSGSGKSTLLYNISGMDMMTSGSVRFDNRELSKLSEKELSKLRLTKMGFIFQQANLLKNLCIKDNILLSAYRAGMESRNIINERAMELMIKTGISSLAKNNITQASGGQLQRVGICRALINNPDIIFGDEPTGALNSKAASEIMEILSEINNSGKTILLVTHDAKVTAKTERVLFMLDGRIVSEKYLGKYKKAKNDLKKREEELSMWLFDMGL